MSLVREVMPVTNFLLFLLFITKFHQQATIRHDVTYLSVVTPDVQASGGKVVFLNEFNSRHKASNSDIVWTMLWK